MESKKDQRPLGNDRGSGSSTPVNPKSTIEFQTQGGQLTFRLARRAVFFRLLPLALSPIVFAFLFLGPVSPVFRRGDPFAAGIVVFGLIGQALYAAYVLRDRFSPFVVDVSANALRRGRQILCALSDIESTGVTIRTGRNQTYFVALTLRAEKKPCRLFAFLLASQAREAVSTLADRLNVPVRADEREGMW